MDLEAARDRIYEAAILPERWPSVLDSIADIAGAVGSILIADDPSNPAFVNSASLDGFLQDFMDGDWGQVDRRMPRLLAAQHDGFLLEEDVFTPEELRHDPLIQDFLRPRGFGWATATFVPQANGGNLIFSVERRYADGPVPRAAIQILDALRGDLARSARLSSNAGLGRGRATVDVLADLDMPAGVISRNGRLTVINDKLKPMLPEIVRDGRERVAFADPQADAMLADFLGSNARSLPFSIPIPRRGSMPPCVVRFVPVRGSVNDVFASGLSIMVITPVVGGTGPTSEILQSLFNLTPAEARVLTKLAEGESPADIAEHHRISVETVRTQLKSVFNKTDTRRQIDLVRLIAGLNARETVTRLS